MHMIPPKRRGRVASWWAMRIGSGIDFGYLYGHISSAGPPSSGELCRQFEIHNHGVQIATAPMAVVDVPLTLGGYLGFGGFDGGTTWRGVVLGAAWTPSFVYITLLWDR